MTVPVQRLQHGARAAIVDHFLALPAEDRRLRFGASLSPEGIVDYVDSIDFHRDAVFGVHDDRLAIIGVAHAALGDEHAELGLSVLPAHRRLGLGCALFERAATHARNRSIPRLFMYCLRENAPIMRIARRFGMIVITNAGDADAHLQLPRASHASISGELVTEGLALYDHALKAHAAAWNRVAGALLYAPPAPVVDSLAEHGTRRLVG